MLVQNTGRLHHESGRNKGKLLFAVIILPLLSLQDRYQVPSVLLHHHLHRLKLHNLHRHFQTLRLLLRHQGQEQAEELHNILRQARWYQYVQIQLPYPDRR